MNLFFNRLLDKEDVKKELFFYCTEKSLKILLFLGIKKEGFVFRKIDVPLFCDQNYFFKKDFKPQTICINSLLKLHKLIHIEQKNDFTKKLYDIMNHVEFSIEVSDDFYIKDIQHTILKGLL